MTESVDQNGAVLSRLGSRSKLTGLVVTTNKLRPSRDVTWLPRYKAGSQISRFEDVPVDMHYIESFPVILYRHCMSSPGLHGKHTVAKHEILEFLSFSLRSAGR